MEQKNAPDMFKVAQFANKSSAKKTLTWNKFLNNIYLLHNPLFSSEKSCLFWSGNIQQLRITENSNTFFNIDFKIEYIDD